MNHSLLVVLTLALAGSAGCIPLPAQSSLAVLGPEASRVTLEQPIASASVLVTQLFTARGYALVDQQPSEDGVVIRLEGQRKTVTATRTSILTDRDHVESTQFGSVFYVWVHPSGVAASTIAVIGRPMVDGREACTGEPGLDLPCEQPYAPPGSKHELDGQAEASIVHGVFSELALQGFVRIDRAAEAAARADADREQCLAIRRDREERARRVSNPRAKRGILRTAPSCS